MNRKGVELTSLVLELSVESFLYLDYSYLYDCFSFCTIGVKNIITFHFLIVSQTSWSQASKKQREKLLELIRRLAEDDKDGVMAHKVCCPLWNLL